MRRFLVAMCLLVVGAGAGAGVFWLRTRDRLVPPAPERTATQDEHSAAPEEAPRLSRTAQGETLIRFEREIQERVGLKSESLAAAERQPEVAAYGLLEEDPAQSFTLRAPVGGVLRAAEATNWPDLNQHLDAGAVVGVLEPRLTPTERIDLATRLTQARADAAEAEAALVSARSSYESKKKLNADNKSVSDRALEEARAQVQSHEARLSAAQQIVQLIESAQSGAGAATGRLELRTEQAGNVVEALVRPGEAVEAGQILLRTVRFDVLLARVEIPLGQAIDESSTTARIVLVGHDDRALTGQRIGLGAGTNAAARGLTLLFRVRIGDQLIRPGTAVIAQVPAPGGKRAGVAIPRGAVVRLLGVPWVYVQTDAESFVRRELTGAELVADMWFATFGFKPGDRVVTDGAQELLSEELKAEIERTEAASE